MRTTYDQMVPCVGSNLYSDLAYECFLELFNDPHSFWIRKQADGMVTFYTTYIQEDPVCKRKRLARKLDHKVHEVASKSLAYHRSDTSFMAEGSHVQVRHALFLRDWLMGVNQQLIKTRYGEDLYKEMVGAPRDPFLVAQHLIKENEREKIIDKYDKLKKDLNAEYDKKSHDLEVACRGELDKLDEEFEKINGGSAI